MIRSRWLALILSVFLGACTAWPPQGSGGMAERQSGGAPLGPENGLQFELELLSRHLDVLILEGAELCFPATVVQARQREIRMQRAIAGGLSIDAANDIIIQRELLARLERQLDYVRAADVCRLPTGPEQETPGALGEQIHTLLNSDNQFALDSAEINPKYVGRLAEAAQLLKQAPAYQLKITGHTDATGEAAHNEALSRARAEQVARYLQIFGLPAHRLQIAVVGSSEPLFQGLEPHVRLTNRRVSVELLQDQTIPLNQQRLVP